MDPQQWTVMLTVMFLVTLIIGIVIGRLMYPWWVRVWSDGFRVVRMGDKDDHAMIPGVIVKDGVSLLEIGEDLKLKAIEAETARRNTIILS